jgi:hypothetical protein
MYCQQLWPARKLNSANRSYLTGVVGLQKWEQAVYAWHVWQLYLTSVTHQIL